MYKSGLRRQEEEAKMKAEKERKAEKNAEETMKAEGRMEKTMKKMSCRLKVNKL
jgi:hypothetical protein